MSYSFLQSNLSVCLGNLNVCVAGSAVFCAAKVEVLKKDILSNGMHLAFHLIEAGASQGALLW